ncbi:MAG: hypothetical protein ACJ8D5_07725 [Sphingomicrobium sp.]
MAARDVTDAAMVRIAFALLLGLWAGAAAARPAPPLYDPVSLNIGLGCQWQQRCIAEQKRAMGRALKYVKKHQPAAWRLHQCNRNAARKRFRVDWVGFDNCIRNASLRPSPPRPVKRRPRVTT